MKEFLNNPKTDSKIFYHFSFFSISESFQRSFTFFLFFLSCIWKNLDFFFLYWHWKNSNFFYHFLSLVSFKEFRLLFHLVPETKLLLLIITLDLRSKKLKTLLHSILINNKRTYFLFYFWSQKLKTIPTKNIFICVPYLHIKRCIVYLYSNCHS